MTQDNVFLEKEGDAWFNRNKSKLGNKIEHDWIFFLAKSLEKKKIKRIVEIGCSNGWRLHFLAKEFRDVEVVGVDASEQAIMDGKKRYPELSLHHGLLSEASNTLGTFELVIVNFVFHWIDRTTLVKSLHELDKLTADGGRLILGDFLPQMQQKRRYHHLPKEYIYTFKQDYAKIFESLGTYRELCRITYDHDDSKCSIKACDFSSRAVCSVLQKSYNDFYPEA